MTYRKILYFSKAGFFWGGGGGAAYFWRGLYSEELMYGGKFVFKNQLG